VIFGRDEAWRALDEVVHSPDRLGSVHLVHGSAGSGKSALLAEAGARWRRRGVRVISVPTAGDHLLERLRETTRSMLAGYSEPGLLDSVAATSRPGATGDDSLPLVQGLTRGLARLARTRRAALVLEDVDRADPEFRPALSLLVQGAKAVGSAVIASTRSRAAGDPRALADDVLELPDLTDADALALISRWSGRKAIDPGVTSALSAALGPLYGNPGTLLSTLRALSAEQRLVTLDGHLCLLRPREPVALAEEHELLVAIRQHGPAAERLASAIAALDGPGVDELPLIAAAFEVDLHSRGSLLDRLIAVGAVHLDAAERLFPAVPALGAALRRGNDQQVRDVRSTLTRHLLDRAERGEPVDREDLADRLVGADQQVSSPLAVELLVEQADRYQRSEPERAVDWYRAAAARLPDTDPRYRRVLRAAVRFQRRLGRYRQLADDFDALAARPAPAGGPRGAVSGAALTEATTCWITALLHEERTDELPEVRRLVLPGSRASTADSGSGDRSGWRPGAIGDAGALLDEVIAHHGPPNRPPGFARAVVDLLGLLDALDADDEEFQRSWQRWQSRSPVPVPDPARVREAGTLGDRSTVLELLLGSGYGRPGSGPLITYQRLVRAYHSGDWDAALSAAREIATDGGTAAMSPAVRMSRAFAAEMCTVRGGFQRAEQWLAGVSDDLPGGHLVSWARAGLRCATADAATAVHEGWQDYLRHLDAGGSAGLERLLGRITAYAHRCGQNDRARAMRDELRSLHERTRTPSGGEVLLMVTGLVEGDSAPVTRSITRARERGDLFRVLTGCAANGDLAADPEPWLREAYGLAKQLGSSGTRSAVGERMRELGIPLPRSRSSHAPFSDTEVRIIDLVSDGLTNRRIASAVGISEKTVESHLTRLLARTGCRSRVELAAAHLEGKITSGAG
jgi:DNA-binding CsgD family transcriptional regulator